MANLKDIRTRIATVSSTRQITSAMKMVSAAKLKKAQDRIMQMRPYSESLWSIVEALCSSLEEGIGNVYQQWREETKKVLIVVVASNRGLCGAFNISVIKEAINLAEDEYTELLENGQVDFMTIGKKAEDILKKRKFKVVKNHNDVYNDLNYENAAAIATELMNGFTSGKYDEIRIVYNQFRNAAVQILTREQYLPLKIEEEETVIHKTFLDYIYEPSMEEIIHEIMPKALRLKIYETLLDSNASEHGARMTSMHKATENATELIKELRLDYNKARQANITNEILEIVSGANALEGE